jgi:PadR family transcriptional regulator, activator of gas vesicle formation
MIEETDGDERIDRLLDELAAYGVIDYTAGPENAGTVGNGDRGTLTRPGTNGSTGAGSVVAGLPLAEDFRFDEQLLKENLEAVLLVLIAVRDGAHGKRLMGDLADFFDAQLSPGTVYPRLHDLEADGVLEVHELVRTKEYSIDDDEGARERIERAMYQHLALGAVFRGALERVRSPSEP